MIWKPTKENISKAAQLLADGEIGAIPTETVYGLAADALNPSAVKKIFDAKKRPDHNPLIVHISDITWLDKLTKESEKIPIKLIETCWPGPLTMVLPKKNIVPDNTTAGRSNVGIRMPNHPIALDIISQSKTVIAAPSANPSNYISPTTAQHVEKMMKNLSFIMDGGTCSVGLESTVISFIEDKPIILRHGFYSFDYLQKFLPDLKEKNKTDNQYQVDAPGQQKIHYAPKTPFKYWKVSEFDPSKKNAFISWSFIPKESFNVIKYLSKTQNIEEASSNLYQILHVLDELNLDTIWIEKIPMSDSRKALLDRIERAVSS